jgi:hypothetical protein
MSLRLGPLETPQRHASQNFFIQQFGRETLAAVRDC